LFAIDVAKAYDRKIIVEKCLEDVREINCAVIGYENNLQTSLCEEPVGWKDFLTYEDKYVNKKKDSSESKRRIPADIDEETETKIKDYATEVFKAVDGCGNARIDFLLRGNNIYVNEINTIPGSIAFYLWEGKGMSFKQLITTIIELAELQHSQRKDNIISYDIDLLNKMGTGGKNK
jgi:D-alanine-D-alanine ligase